jgi:hypothetical protein
MHVADVIDALTWFADSKADTGSIQVHVTGSVNQKAEQSDDEKSSEGDVESSREGDSEKRSPRGPLPIRYGRPDVSQLIREFGRDASARSRVAVIGKSLHISSVNSVLAWADSPVCGPAALVNEAGQGCKDVQWSIARGQYDLSEMWLHRETFSW